MLHEPSSSNPNAQTHSPLTHTDLVPLLHPEQFTKYISKKACHARKYVRHKNKVLLLLQSGKHPCFDIWLPRQLILYIIQSMAMKLHVYGTLSTMYMYVDEQMLILYFKNVLFLFLVDFKLRKSN